MRTRPIDSNWTFTRLNPGPGYPQPNVAHQGWLPATVPGHVHLDLMANGIIEDPFCRMAELGCRWVDEADWSYRTTFDWTPDPALPRRVLRFEGLDTLCRITLNGEEIARHDNMFLPVEVDVTDRLVEGENELRLDFESPVRIGQARREAYFESEGLATTTERFDERAFVRKAGYMWAWDWGPRLVSCGIWRPVSLVEYAARITSFEVSAAPVMDAVEGGGFIAHLEAIVEGEADLTLTFGEHSFTRSAGESPEVDVAVFYGKLWWPAGMGEQHLYSATARLDNGHEVVRKVGLRTIELRRERDEFGESFEFVVNGRRVWARGANWIPNDSFPSRVSPEDYQSQIAACRTLGMNMLRVWGGGLYEQEAFYDACDEAGILVWQDFPYACSYYPDDAAAQAVAEAEAAHHVRRLRGRACLAMWCGNNENHQMWEGKWGGLPNNPPRFYGEPIYEQVLPAVLAELDPGRPYIPSSPIGTPPPGERPGMPGGVNAGGWGDSHYWDVWHGRGDWKFYLESDARFSSEFGFASSPSVAQWDAALAPQDRDFEGPVVRWHDKTKKEWETYRGYVTAHYAEPESLEDWVYYSQLNQRDALRCGIEHYRRSEFCRGSLIWQFNDCWPVQSWAVQDHLRLLKPAGYELARLYADRLVSLFVAPEGVEAHVVNDGAAPLEGSLALEVFSTMTGETRARREIAVSLGAGERRRVHVEPVSGWEPAETAVRATLLASGEILRAVTLLAEPKETRVRAPRLSTAVEGEELLLTVEGAAIDLVVWDPDDPFNLSPQALEQPGWDAVTLANETRRYRFRRKPSRLCGRSVAGVHEVSLDP